MSALADALKLAALAGDAKALAVASKALHELVGAPGEPAEVVDLNARRRS